MLVPHSEGHGEASHESHSMLEGFRAMGTVGKMEVLFVFVVCGWQILMVIRQLKMRIQTSAFCEQMRKLIASGNPERAAKLCAAAPQSVVALLVKVGLEARNGQSARDAIDAAYPQFLAAARSGLILALVSGALALVAGASLIAEDGFSNIGTIPLGVVAILLTLNAMRYVAWPGELSRARDVFG